MAKKAPGKGECGEGKSRRATGTSSETSIDSIGMGLQKQPSEDVSYVPRLLAEGPIPEGQSTYDCILFLMLCEEHNRIAICNVEQTKVVWLPFVAIQPANSWEEAAEDGLRRLLTIRPEENIYNEQAKSSKAETDLPKYKMTNIHFFRIQQPSGKFKVRITQFVRIYKTAEYECCQDNRILMWIDARDVLNDNLRCGPLWGPEVKLFISNLIKTETKFISEFCLNKVLALISQQENKQLSSGLQIVSKVVFGNKVSQETILAMYEDFIDFCFPSFYMCNESFKMYFRKFGFNKNDTELFAGLFRAVSNAVHRKGYLDWSEFIMAAFCLDPTTEHDEGRCLFLFHFYNRSGNNQIEMTDFMRMLKDLNPKLSEERIADEIVQLCNFKENKLSLEDFQVAIKKEVLKGTDKLLRASTNIISIVVSEVKKRWSNTSGSKKPTAKRRNRGICNGCRAQNLQYCLHAVTFDTTGRCVNPMRISKYEVANTNQPIDTLFYSAEIRFGTGISYSFIDVIRKRATMTNVLFTPGQDKGEVLVKYMANLLDMAKVLLKNEDRLMKINAPVEVIGEIRGNLAAVITIEKLLCPTVPVLQSNLVFLGNYICPKGVHNVEVLCFLLALKTQSPNKVILLRGHNESVKEASRILLKECESKYGNVGKQVCSLLCSVLEMMPFAVIIDESILCLHSGLPVKSAAASNVNMFADIPSPLSNVEDNAVALEITCNVPMETATGNGLEFTHKQFRTFMQTNNLSFLIRSNSAGNSSGYSLHFDARCISLDSHTAKPMVVLIDPGKKLHGKLKEVKDIQPTIRVVQLENSNSSSSVVKKE